MENRTQSERFLRGLWHLTCARGKNSNTLERKCATIVINILPPQFFISFRRTLAKATTKLLRLAKNSSKLNQIDVQRNPKNTK